MLKIVFLEMSVSKLNHSIVDIKENRNFNANFMFSAQINNKL